MFDVIGGRKRLDKLAPLSPPLSDNKKSAGIRPEATTAAGVISTPNRRVYRRKVLSPIQAPADATAKTFSSHPHIFTPSRLVSKSNINVNTPKVTDFRQVLLNRSLYGKENNVTARNLNLSSQEWEHASPSSIKHISSNNNVTPIVKEELKGDSSLLSRHCRAWRKLFSRQILPASCPRNKRKRDSVSLHQSQDSDDSTILKITPPSKRFQVSTPTASTPSIRSKSTSTPSTIKSDSCTKFFATPTLPRPPLATPRISPQRYSTPGSWRRPSKPQSVPARPPKSHRLRLGSLQVSSTVPEILSRLTTGSESSSEGGIKGGGRTRMRTNGSLTHSDNRLSAHFGVGVAEVISVSPAYINYNDLINANSGPASNANTTTCRVSHNPNSTSPQECNKPTPTTKPAKSQYSLNSPIAKEIGLHEKPALESIILQARKELWDERKRLYTWTGAVSSPRRSTLSTPRTLSSPAAACPSPLAVQSSGSQEHQAYMDMEFPTASAKKNTSMESAEYIDMATGL